MVALPVSAITGLLAFGLGESLAEVCSTCL